jgi:transcriptional regulator with GAF, ATPase, and Fis domain
LLGRLAPTEVTLTLVGETGTGKDVLANAVHSASPRANGPFVVFDCGAVAQNLAESELFGHERGSFTGAQARKRGFFEQAHGGTLFLDEIGDMDLTAQAKVLRALQNGEIVRVGSEHVFNVDVRVLAATNKDLSKAVAAGTFREDLFFRLDVFPMRVPALRDRRGDIPLLAESFVGAFCRENGLRAKRIDPAVHEALTRRSWPGNVRELKNVVERAAILSSDILTIADLPEDPHLSPFEEDLDASDETRPTPPPPMLSPSGERPTLREHRDAAERHYIIEVLRELEWNISRAAVVLGVERTNLHKKIRAYGIKRGEA